MATGYKMVLDLSRELGYSVKAGYIARVCREHGLGRRLNGMALTPGEVRRLKRILAIRKTKETAE